MNVICVLDCFFTRSNKANEMLVNMVSYFYVNVICVLDCSCNVLNEYLEHNVFKK